MAALGVLGRLKRPASLSLLSQAVYDPDPSVRAFAAEQSANPLTVAKAYQGFQDEGLITVKRGVGMFVAPGASARLRESERSRFVKDEWPAVRERMKRLGIDPVRLLDQEIA